MNLYINRLINYSSHSVKQLYTQRESGRLLFLRRYLSAMTEITVNKKSQPAGMLNDKIIYLTYIKCIVLLLFPAVVHFYIINLEYCIQYINI